MTPLRSMVTICTLLSLSATARAADLAPSEGDAADSAITVDVDGSVYTVTGSSSADDLILDDLDADGLHTLTDDLTGVAWDLSGATSVVVYLGDGDDDFSAADADLSVEVYGDGGSDMLIGGMAADMLYGGANNDVLSGMEGADVLDGGKGRDDLSGDAGADILRGANGTDTLSGGDGNDRLNGGNGNDALNGGNGNDTLYGGPGSDTLDGDSGDDNLYGHWARSCGTTDDTIDDDEGDNFISAYPDMCDVDADGYTSTEDCDDEDAAVNPGAEEACDGVDNDCDDSVDEDDVCAADDADGDGYDAEIDCDDSNADVNPGADEACGDGVDNDCNGFTDA
ncbi:MAG: MopE-related protein, partial [Myxococcota bacterium]